MNYWKKLRDDMGLTQAEFAQGIGIESRQFLCAIESGEKYPPLEKLSKIAKFTGIPLLTIKKEYFLHRLSHYEQKLKKRLGL